MQTQTFEKACENRVCTLKESRSSRFNLPVIHPPKWQLLFERLLASPLRLHRYRVMSARMLEETIEQMDERHCR